MVTPTLPKVADARALPLPDACVDLTVTSPPYALDIGYIGGDVRAETWPDFMADWLTEALRVTKTHGRLALNVPIDTSRGGKRPTYVQACQAALDVGWSYQATITWHEGHTSKGDRSLGTINSSRRPQPIDSSEMILLLSKGSWGPSSQNADDITPAEWQPYGRGPWRFPGEPRRPGGHPAPFPAELPHGAIRYLSRVGDVVCDPFVGSGTTVAVAHRLGRGAIGFDLAPAYIEMGRRRVLGAPEAAYVTGHTPRDISWGRSPLWMSLTLTTDANSLSDSSKVLVPETRSLRCQVLGDGKYGPAV